MARYAWVFVVIFLCNISLRAADPVPKGAVPLVAASAAILMDARTGLVLWGHHAELPLPMASTTKVMTAMVLLDHGGERLSEPVTVSQHAFATGGSSLLAAGDTLTLGDVLKAALIRSSNEATVAAAEFLAGDEATFVGWMNDKARELGLQHTHFVNPHGLYDPVRGKQHYSSARDLAEMARYALAHYPLIRQIVATGYPKPVFINVTPRGQVRLENRDKILNQPVPGISGSRVDGVKTGYVKESGKCLVSSATLNGWQLIAVSLNSPDPFKENRSLLHYGFRRYAWQTYASPRQAGTDVAIAWGARRTVPVGTRDLLGAPVLRLEFGDSPDDRIVFAGKRRRAPVKKGEEMGTLEVRRGDRCIASAPAIALETIPVAWWARLLAVSGYGILILAILTIIGKLYGTRAKNARRRRRLLASSRRGTDIGRASNGQR